MNRGIKVIFLSFLLVVITIWESQAQSSIDDLLRVFEAKKINLKTRQESGYVLVSLAQRVNYSALLKQEVTPLRVLEDKYVILSTSDAAKLEVPTIYAINNKWKLSGNLLFKPLINSDLIIKTSSEIRSDELYKMAPNTYKVESGQYDIQQLLADERIYYIGSESTKPTIESRVLDMNLNPNRVNMIHRYYPDLKGNDITVSIQEQAFDVDDIDIKGRTITSGLESSVQNNHATEMATIIAGAGNTFVTGKGVAPGASITSSDFEDVLPDNKSSYTDLNAFIQNHSYGTEIENFYGALAEAYDQSTLDNPKLLHVFSSGNAGQSVATDGTYANVVGYANLTGNFKQSKNTLTIGSVDTVNIHPIFVSNGPTYDGRIKPEIVTYSTVGASNSAALVSGVVALMQEAYFNSFSEYPESALIKAVLVNEAEDVGLKGPDFRHGFGNIDAYGSVQSIIDQNIISGNIMDGQTQVHYLLVPAGARNLKITLSWLDDLGIVNSSKALINDIDLQVFDGTTNYLPWVLNADPNNLNSLATRGEDHLNNIEQVMIDDPVSGNYEISITGFDISMSSLKYYIAYSWEMADEFTWAFPTSIDNMPYNGETRGYYRWNTTFTGSGKLEYTLDDGVTWNVIANNVDVSKEYFSWQPPLLTGLAKARMTIDGNIYETETFTLSRTLNFDVVFNCGDSILVSWGKDNHAIGYDIESLSSMNIFQPFVNTSDTGSIIYKSGLESGYLRIKPIYDTNFEAIGSQAFNYELSGTSCYLSSFSGNVVNDIVELRLEIELDYGVNEVQFEKLTDSETEIIDSQQSNGSVYIAEDTNPTDGINLYIASIHFDNDEVIQTDTIAVYYLNNLKVLVYPNPISSLDFLTVRLKEFDTIDAEFQLINRSGQLVYSQLMFSESNSIILPDVSSGVYIYRIITSEGVISEKLVILRE